jgi:hypothetical protein
MHKEGWDEILMYWIAKKEENEMYVDGGRVMATVSI